MLLAIGQTKSTVIYKQNFQLWPTPARVLFAYWMPFMTLVDANVPVIFQSA